MSVGSIDAVPNLSLFPNPMNADHAMVYLSGLPDEQTVIRVIASDGRVAWEGTGIVTNPESLDTPSANPSPKAPTSSRWVLPLHSRIPLMVW